MTNRTLQFRTMTRLVLATVPALFLLTGCVDVVQYISGSGSTIDVYLRLTLQKSVFEMVNSVSGDTQDPDEMFEEGFELDRESVQDELPPGVEADYRRVNDEFEYGFELTYSAPRETLAGLGEEGAAFVPRVGTRGMTIPLAEGGETNDAGGEGEEFAAGFLGGAKYRVFISRRLVSRISAARITTPNDSVEVTVIELPDVWLVQFPVSVWLMSEQAPTLEIVY